MMRRPVVIGLMALALTTLAGCGFQLRGLGQAELPFSDIALSANVSPFSEIVRQRLQSAGPRIDDSADLRLNLGDEQVRDRRLTRADSGSRETEITLTAPFSVQRVSDGAYLLSQQQLETSTTVLLSDDNLYASDEMRKQTVERLRREAADQLIDRLAALDTP
ncbi:LPS assembly lipoprotein LptE [Salinicola endophyticus]|uniref:LPS-assembly lipoprotein LptE n=1 Tax=Salinicola endophyticus TaxID=1949083 RepID=A0AB74UIN2_9GAMM